MASSPNFASRPISLLSRSRPPALPPLPNPYLFSPSTEAHPSSALYSWSTLDWPYSVCACHRCPSSPSLLPYDEKQPCMDHCGAPLRYHPLPMLKLDFLPSPSDTASSTSTSYSACTDCLSPLSPPPLCLPAPHPHPHKTHNDDTDTDSSGPRATAAATALPIAAPRPVPWSTPALLRADVQRQLLPDVDEDLSHPPYTCTRRQQRRSAAAVVPQKRPAEDAAVCGADAERRGGEAMVVVQDSPRASRRLRTSQSPPPLPSPARAARLLPSSSPQQQRRPPRTLRR